MSKENEIFEIPQEENHNEVINGIDSKNQIKPKKARKKRELTEEQKEVLRERLKKAREARKLKSSSKSKQIKNHNKVINDSKGIKVKEEEKLNSENLVVAKQRTSEIETVIESDSEKNTTAEPEPDLNDLDNTEKEIMNLQLDIEEMNEKLTKKKKRSENAKKGAIIRQRQNIDSIVEKKVNEKLAKLNSVVQDEVKKRKAPKKTEPVKKAPEVALKVDPPKPKVKPVGIGCNTPFWAM